MDPWDAYYEAQNAISSNANSISNESNKYDEHEDHINTNHDHQDHHNNHANCIGMVDTANNSNLCIDTMPAVISIDVSTLHANPSQNLCAAIDQSHHSNELEQVQNTHTEHNVPNHIQDTHDSHNAIDPNEQCAVHEFNPANGLTDQSQCCEPTLTINNHLIDDVPSDTNNDLSKQVRTDLIDIFFVSFVHVSTTLQPRNV